MNEILYQNLSDSRSRTEPDLSSNRERRDMTNS